MTDVVVIGAQWTDECTGKIADCIVRSLEGPKSRQAIVANGVRITASAQVRAKPIYKMLPSWKIRCSEHACTELKRSLSARRRSCRPARDEMTPSRSQIDFFIDSNAPRWGSNSSDIGFDVDAIKQELGAL